MPHVRLLEVGDQLLYLRALGAGSKRRYRVVASNLSVSHSYLEIETARNPVEPLCERAWDTDPHRVCLTGGKAEEHGVSETVGLRG